MLNLKSGKTYTFNSYVLEQFQVYPKLNRKSRKFKKKEINNLVEL